VTGGNSGRVVAADLDRLAALLDYACRQRRTLTYLEVADALAIQGPRRIDKTARLLESLLQQDAQAGRPIRAALVTSRSRPGLPARGFFDCARRLGLCAGSDQAECHAALLERLYRESPDRA